MSEFNRWLPEQWREGLNWLDSQTHVQKVNGSGGKSNHLKSPNVENWFLTTRRKDITSEVSINCWRLSFMSATQIYANRKTSTSFLRVHGFTQISAILSANSPQNHFYHAGSNRHWEFANFSLGVGIAFQFHNSWQGRHSRIDWWYW